MARGGIYKTEVVRARNNLLALGRNPSIDAIRSELGNTGSKTTIHRYLKEIEEEEGIHNGKKVAASDAILDLSSRLAERLHQEADERIATLTDKHKEDLAKLNDIIAALRNEVDSFRGQSERLTLELTAEKKAHADTRTKLQEEKLANAQLIQHLRDLESQQTKAEEHRQSLEEKHRHAREALEHFRTAAKEQREQDCRQYEQQIQFLQGELRIAKDSITSKQQELMVSHENNARLSSELIHVRNDFNNLDQEVRMLRHSKERLGVAELKNEQLMLQLAKASERETVLIAENKNSAERLQERIAVGQQLETELLTARAVIATHERILQTLAPPQTVTEK
ncbi:DNA-binding protein [Methylomonas sp. ZR1]|uniref:DNA-binding protein n=1 Tax=Methylomonas sp. ZR1 TaxID=1797072 RepID=UPI00149313D7|nr:DNA-binding protein [Methylomonas sp. ZR1]NOV29555.1 DNA-binding protein [Methylomonas sp. ZR1]